MEWGSGCSELFKSFDTIGPDGSTFGNCSRLRTHGCGDGVGEWTGLLSAMMHFCGHLVVGEGVGAVNGQGF